MYNYALRAHYPEDKKKNFSLPKAKQNPFFGLEPVLEELLRIANSIRFPSRALSVDEELIYLSSFSTGTGNSVYRKGET